MPIPFHDADDVEELGAAAFLHIESPSPGSSERFGALLFINARGEPMEFAYNRIDLMGGVLWRNEDRARAAARRLAVTLFDAATLTPNVLLCRANVVDPHIFGPTGQLALDVPVGRVATATEAVGYTGKEQQTAVETQGIAGQTEEVHLFWTPEPPSGQAAELLCRLTERGLLLEPFERASQGLREVYSDPQRTPK